MPTHWFSPLSINLDANLTDTENSFNKRRWIIEEISLGSEIPNFWCKHVSTIDYQQSLAFEFRNEDTLAVMYIANARSGGTEVAWYQYKWQHNVERGLPMQV